MSQASQRSARVILGLCGVFGVFAATLLSLRGKSGAEGALCVGFCVGATLLAGLILRLRPLFAQPQRTICALVGLYMGLCLRVCLFPFVSGDYVSFLSGWLETMRNQTIRQSLALPLGDYNMPYLYLLLLISRLPVYDLYAIKLASVLADVFLALGAGYLAKLTARREALSLAAFFAVLLAPTVFLNSGYWGQCDGIYACFGLWGLYWGIKRRPLASMVCFALAFAFKLQAVFLLPIVAFLVVRGDVRPRQLLAFPATFLLVMLPPLLAGRSVADTFGIYFDQTAAYPYLSLNAPSFWSLIPNEYFGNLDPAPVLAAGMGTLLLLYAFLRRADRMSPGDLVDVSLIFCLAIPWMLPRMHERYFYLAEVLSILYGARHPRRLGVPVGLLFGGFLIYCPYLFGGMAVLSNGAVAAGYGLLLLYLVLRAWRDTAGETPART